MNRVRVIPAGIAQLRRSDGVVDALRDVAEDVLDAAESIAPSGIRDTADFYVRAGVNREGEAFSQAIARGSGTQHVEYNVQPYMRPALRVIR